MSLLKRISGGVLEFLYPQDLVCSACDGEANMGTGFGICESCLANIGFGEFTRLQDYWCLTSFFYDGAGEVLIKRLKYQRKQYIAYTLAELMLQRLAMYDLRADVCCPVPLHPKRERERGFNQSDLVMRLVAKELGLPYEKQLLQRIKDTEQLAGKSREERQKIMKGAFACHADLNGKRVMILDDVITTGSTMLSCASEIAKCGGTPVLLGCARA